MIPTAPEPHDLDEIYELNRLFLGFLRERAPDRVECLDLAPQTARLLGKAAPPMLESAALVPRALFRLRLEVDDGPRVRERHGGSAEQAAHALQLTLLHSAWNLSRRSGYKARLFLGLSLAQLRHLRAMPLSKLPSLAARPGLIGCAFGGAHWLWRGLLTETRPELKRQLLLIMLQPEVAQPSAARHAARRAVS
jgi:hypothetical protein